MWSVFIPTDRASTDALSADLWELDTAGWVEEAYGLRAFFEDAADQNAICAKLGLSVAEVRHEAAFDVNQVKVLACEPILIGERFFVSPSWVTEPTPAGRFRLTIDATNAFGSGRHESTQMCIEVLEKHLKAGHCVADVGCGSGILTAAAT